jgi:hypothetical protein
MFPQIGSTVHETGRVIDQEEIPTADIPQTIGISKHEVGWRKVVRNFTPS